MSTITTGRMSAAAANTLAADNDEPIIVVSEACVWAVSATKPLPALDEDVVVLGDLGQAPPVPAGIKALYAAPVDSDPRCGVDASGAVLYWHGWVDDRPQWADHTGEHAQPAYPVYLWGYGDARDAYEQGIERAGSLEERLSLARLELEHFEAQPPLGARKHAAGRNARMVVIEDLEARLADQGAH